MYLLASEVAIRLVLVREENVMQIPIYFVSHILINPNFNKSNIEKLVLALIKVRRKLRPYFGAHLVKVTD